MSIASLILQANHAKSVSYWLMILIYGISDTLQSYSDSSAVHSSALTSVYYVSLSDFIKAELAGDKEVMRCLRFNFYCILLQEQ
jgi:hypothetical protein